MFKLRQILQLKGEHLLIIAIFLSSLLFFYTSINNYFFQDDFFHIKLSLSQSLLESFNLFHRAAFDFYIFRPLTTQLFWKVGYLTFGLNQIAFHLIMFLFYFLNLYLVYLNAKILTKNKRISLLALFLYAFSASHFYRLYFLSQFQELGLGFFTLLAVFVSLKGHHKISLFFLFLSLFCKETSVVIPVILALTAIYQGQLLKTLKYWLVGVILVVIYFVVRSVYFGNFTGGVYAYDFHLKSTINNYFWYFLWTIGVPEWYANVKILSGPKVLNPLLWTGFGQYGPYIVLLSSSFLATITFCLLRMKAKISAIRPIIFGATWYFIFLLPVAFFPFHKFGYSLTMPIFGSSLILAVILAKSKKSLAFLCLSLYFLLSLTTLRFNLENHWSVKLSYTAKKVMQYFSNKYPERSTLPVVYFRSTDKPECPINMYASSDIQHAISNGDALGILYPGSSSNIYFESSDLYKNFRRANVYLDSNLFIK